MMRIDIRATGFLGRKPLREDDLCNQTATGTNAWREKVHVLAKA
jgi:hypothetical protein